MGHDIKFHHYADVFRGLFQENIMNMPFIAKADLPTLILYHTHGSRIHDTYPGISGRPNVRSFLVAQATYTVHYLYQSRMFVYITVAVDQC